MACTIEIIRHFDRKIPESNVKLNIIPTFAVPFRRQGVESSGNVEKTRDEELRMPSEKLFIPNSILSAGAEIVQTKKFTPEYLVNLRGIRLEEDSVVIDANHVNYGVLPTLRDLTGMFPEELMQPVLNQLAPIAVRAVMVSYTHGLLYLGRRSNVDRSGKIDTYPAGTVSEGFDLGSALREEAKVEAGFEIGRDGTADLIGLSRGRSDGPNPNFVYLIETDWIFERLKKNTGREHNKVYAFELKEDIIKTQIKRKFVTGTSEYGSINDVGLAALLQAGRKIFGLKWYSDIINELRDLKSTTINILKE